MKEHEGRESSVGGLTITARITIWYMCVMVIIAVMLMTVLFRVYDQRIRSGAEARLVRQRRGCNCRRWSRLYTR